MFRRFWFVGSTRDRFKAAKAHDCAINDRAGRRLFPRKRRSRGKGKPQSQAIDQAQQFSGRSP
jgi:hypothetical protein